MKKQFAASVAEVEAFMLPYLLDEQAAFAAGDAALPAAGCRRRCGTPPPGPLSTSEWPPLAATLARVPRPGGFGRGNNLLSDSQLKAKEVNGVGEMQHGAPAYSQPKALEVNGDGEVQLEAQANLNGDGEVQHGRAGVVSQLH